MLIGRRSNTHGQIRYCKTTRRKARYYNRRRRARKSNRFGRQRIERKARKRIARTQPRIQHVRTSTRFRRSHLHPLLVGLGRQGCYGSGQAQFEHGARRTVLNAVFAFPSYSFSNSRNCFSALAFTPSCFAHAASRSPVFSLAASSSSATAGSFSKTHFPAF